MKKKTDLSFTHIQTSKGARARLVNRGGNRPRTIRYGLKNRAFSDIFHALLGASWTRLLFLILFFLVAANFLFALAYFVDPYSVAGIVRVSARWPMVLLDDFFFSVQTMATVGYGHIWPADVYGNCVATFEAFFGLITFAMASALLFTRLARPTAKVLFSKVAVTGVRNGRTCLMFRLANARGNPIIAGNVGVALLRREVTSEGEVVRTFVDLPLSRQHIPILALTWTVLHYIDEASPLYNETYESLRDREIEVVVSFTGVDEVYSQQVYARHSYILEEIRWSEKFVDILSSDDKGRIVVDYRKFHLTQTHESLPI